MQSDVELGVSSCHFEDASLLVRYVFNVVAHLRECWKMASPKERGAIERSMRELCGIDALKEYSWAGCCPLVLCLTHGLNIKDGDQLCQSVLGFAEGQRQLELDLGSRPKKGKR